MSYPNPDTSAVTLKGIDNLIQTIQLKVKDSLTWVNESFGLTDRIVESRNEKPYIYPAIFQNGKDPISLMPSDEWGNFCFWTKDIEAKFDVKQPSPNRAVLNTYTVHCIFYTDIGKFTTIPYKTAKSYMVNDILNFFNTVKVAGILTPVRLIEDDITKVYEGFTLTEEDNKYGMYPKWSCRITFELSFWEPCYSTNSYS